MWKCFQCHLSLVLVPAFALAAFAFPGFVQAADQPRPNILFILADDLGYGDLGCYGSPQIRTPNIDRLASSGINYRRAHNQNVVCMPARSTMITGQYVRTHGVVANGVALPPDSPSVASYLHTGLSKGTTRPSTGRLEATIRPSLARAALIAAARDAGVSEHDAPRVDGVRRSNRGGVAPDRRRSRSGLP